MLARKKEGGNCSSAEQSLNGWARQGSGLRRSRFALPLLLQGEQQLGLMLPRVCLQVLPALHLQQPADCPVLGKAQVVVHDLQTGPCSPPEGGGGVIEGGGGERPVEQPARRPILASLAARGLPSPTFPPFLFI